MSPFLNQEPPPPLDSPASLVKSDKETPGPQNRRERRQLAKAEAAEAKKKGSASPPSSPPEPKELSKPKETQAEFAKKHSWRVTILPIIPLLATFVRPPVLPKPLPEPYYHPTAPLRVLSSVHSAYSGVVLVGEVLPPTPSEVEAGNVTEPHSLRYLRAGHSLLGGVWIGDRVYRRDGSGPLQLDSDGNPIGDSIYGTFNMQEAVRLVSMPETGLKKNALVMSVVPLSNVSPCINGVAGYIVVLGPESRPLRSCNMVFPLPLSKLIRQCTKLPKNTLRFRNPKRDTYSSRMLVDGYITEHSCCRVPKPRVMPKPNLTTFHCSTM